MPKERRQEMRFYKEKFLLSQLKNQIDKAPAGCLAALDADGTLWPEDANDILLDYEQKKALRDFKNLLDPYYREESHRKELCELFAKGQAGWRLEEFRFYCREALREKPLNPFPFQKNLLEHLKKRGFRICIVTASVGWLVEEAVKLYSLPVDKVLGAKTELKGDIISDKLLKPSPISYKAKAFLNFSQGEKCFLAGGNTKTDLQLLQMAQAPFAVHSAPPKSLVFPAEKKLKNLAIQKGWIVFER